MDPRRVRRYPQSGWKLPGTPAISDGSSKAGFEAGRRAPPPVLGPRYVKQLAAHADRSLLLVHEASCVAHDGGDGLVVLADGVVVAESDVQDLWRPLPVFDRALDRRYEVVHEHELTTRCTVAPNRNRGPAAGQRRVDLPDGTRHEM